MKKALFIALCGAFFAAFFTACGGTATKSTAKKAESTAQKPVKEVPKDTKSLLKAACETQNSAQACFDLGFEYGKDDYPNANRYFAKACDLGDQMGCDNYKILNERGIR